MWQHATSLGKSFWDLRSGYLYLTAHGHTGNVEPLLCFDVHPYSW